MKTSAKLNDKSNKTNTRTYTYTNVCMCTHDTKWSTAQNKIRQKQRAKVDDQRHRLKNQ